MSNSLVCVRLCKMCPSMVNSYYILRMKRFTKKGKKKRKKKSGDGICAESLLHGKVSYTGLYFRLRRLKHFSFEVFISKIWVGG